jgi:archaemetzincin
MNVVHLLPVGRIDLALLEELRLGIPRSLHVKCEIAQIALDPASAYHAERQQFHSSEILQRMQSGARPGDWRLLAVADVDLYIPILKYVFGEAQLGGPCAVISAYRLRQEFYGLERDEGLLRERLLKEAVHELGHTLGLRHCEEYTCCMASSHAVEWIDLKERTFCESCRPQVESKIPLFGTRYVLANHKSSLP